MLPTATVETPAIDRSACPSTRGHGTRHYRYTHGCRCPDSFRDAKRNRVRKETRQLLTGLYVPGAGTARRLQGLAVHGFGIYVIARELDMDPSRVNLLRAGSTRVTPALADRIRHVTDDLRRQTPPTPGPVTARALQKQWAGLDEWIDIDDPAELPDSAYRRDVAAAPPAAPEDVPLATLKEMRDLGRPLSLIAESTGLDAVTIENRLQDAASDYRQTRSGSARLTDEQVYAIRDEYLRTRTTTWVGTQVAARYGKAPCTISAIIHGRGRPELDLTDLTVAAPCTALHARGGPPPQLTDAQLHAVRADYLAGLGERRLARKHGIGRSLADRIIRGRIRPALGLSDLTAHKRGEHTAAPPTSREIGKESAA